MALKIIIVLCIAVLVAAFGLFIFLDLSSATLHEATGLVVGLESFPVYLETHPLMKALPKDASVAITIGGQAYGISGNSVSVDTVRTDADISIGLPAGYDSRIGEIGFCSALKEAVADNVLQIETSASKMKLLFKYRKLLKYRDCLEA